MPRAKLIVLVAMSLLLAQLQCVAACTNDLCDGTSSASLPPCHRHHSHSKGSSPNCLYQTMVSSVMSDRALPIELQPFSGGTPAVAAATPAPVEASFRALPFFVGSPPCLYSLSSVVLRI